MPQTNLPASNWLQSLFQNVNRRLAALENKAPLVTSAAEVITVESYSVNSWGDCPTPGPSTTAVIGFSGSALVTICANAATTAAGQTSEIGLSIDGSTPVQPWGGTFDQGAASGASISLTQLVTGLTPGKHTFEMKYQVSTSGVSGTFGDRLISVQPL